MTTTLELVTFTATPTVLANPDTLKEGLAQYHRSQDAAPTIYYGIQHEDKATAYVALVWEVTPTFPTRLDLDKHIDAYRDTTHPTAKILAQLTPAILKAFDSPVTEVAFMTNKTGVTTQVVLDTLKEMTKVVPKASFGEVVEGTGDVVGGCGWDSVEAHYEAVKGVKGPLPILEYADITVIHVAFTKAL